MAKKGSWKKERATVHRRGSARSKSNKYSDNDQTKPRRGRSRVWVGGYTRQDGTRVEGHYRTLR
jgi:hypothetical protein